MRPFDDEIPAEDQEQPITAGKRRRARLAQAVQEPVDQAACGTGSLLVSPKTSPHQRPIKRLLGLVAAVLIVALLIGSWALLFSQRQPQGAARVGGTFVVTPDGGALPDQTPYARPGDLFVSIPPDAAYYLNGFLYHDTSVYDASTGAPATQYQPHLGNLPVVGPQLVNGIVYMVGRVASKEVIGKATLFALRPADGSVLWEWNNCGESDNLEGPVFSGSSIYLTCEVAPTNWRLVSLQSRTGALLWSQQLAGEPSYTLVSDQQGVYVSVLDRLQAWSPTTGHLLWQRSFVAPGRLQSDNYLINSIYLGQGVVYVSDGDTFTALATSSGKTIWAYQFRGDYLMIQAVLAPQTVYLFAYEQSRRTTVYAVNSLTGAQHWHRLLPGSPDWPTMDQGNLYLVYNVFSDPSASDPTPVSRMLLALRGSDGRTLWQTEIPWNSHHLSYAEIELPFLTFGAGRVYLVDWRSATSFESQQGTSLMAAFSERNGALLWSATVE